MFPRGVIYNSKSGLRHGRVNLQASVKQVILYSFVRGLGAGLVAFAVIITLFMYWPIIKEEAKYNTTKITKATEVPVPNQEAGSLGLDPAF